MISNQSINWNLYHFNTHVQIVLGEDDDMGGLGYVCGNYNKVVEEIFIA